MVIRQPLYGFPAATAPRPVSRNRDRTIAIGLSVAVHLMIGVYIVTATFHPFNLGEAEPGSPPIDAQTIIFNPPKPLPAPTIKTPVPTNTHDAGPVVHTVDTVPLQVAHETHADTVTMSPFGAPDVVEGVKLGLPPVGPVAITNPDWLSRPGAAEFARAYPPRAIAANVGGAVMLECLVTAAGGVSGCAVVSESPASFGFGKAAL